MRLTLLLFSTTFLLFLQSLNAQRPGNRGAGNRPELSPDTGALAGKAVDAGDDAEIAFANVIIYQAGTETMQDGGITNDGGRFFIKDLPYGSYDVVISFVGYTDAKKENITIDADNRVGRVGRVALMTGTALETVEVTAEKSEITFGLDKKTFNVEKQITSTGGTAEDVLRNIPSITFDTDGNLSLRGTSNVRILINGKPSALTGAGRNAVLEQIPASTIKDVEVLTNPNAKYDPDGTGGIINIITKKQNRAGFNLQTALNIGTRNKYDGNINLNWRVGKFNTFLNYAGRYGEYFRERTSRRTQTFADTAFTRNSYNYSLSTRTSHTVKGGAEYFFSPQASLTASVTYNPSSRTGISDGEGEFIDATGNLTDTSVQRGSNNETETDMEYDVNYFHRFKKEGQELSISARYSTSTETEFGVENEQFFDINGVNYNFFGNEVLEDESSSRLRTQIDYVHPVGKKGKIETGYQVTAQNIDNEYLFDGLDDVSRDYELDNRFIYDEQIHALYGIYTGEKSKFAYSFGLRAEQALTDAESVNAENPFFSNDYFRLYPSGSISYKTGEKSTVQASYSRRVNRPRSRSLNPFQQVRDSLNFRQGNPELLPEFINSYEINYLVYSKKGTFSAGLYYRKTNDVISRFQEIRDNGIVISTWTNLESAQNYGIEIVGTYRPAKYLRFTANTNIYRTVINGENVESDLTNSGYLASGRVSANVTFLKATEFQIASFMRSAGVGVQGNYRPVSSIDLALKQPILKGKGEITLRVSDPLNTRDFEIDIDQPNLDQYFKFKRESRILFLGFSYALRQDKSKRRRGGERRGGGGGGEDADF